MPLDLEISGECKGYLPLNNPRKVTLLTVKISKSNTSITIKIKEMWWSSKEVWWFSKEGWCKEVWWSSKEVW